MQTFPIKIYIAGPYTSAPKRNVKRAIDVANIFLDVGLQPYIPHLTHYWHKRYPNLWQRWLELDEAFLGVCDALYRFEGPSAGADSEVAFAKKKGIPCYHKTHIAIYELTGLVQCETG